MRLHRTTTALDRVNFALVFFSYHFSNVYDPNLTFSIARILCRFCLSANCERALHYMFSISNKLLFTHQALASKFSDHDIVTVTIIISVITGNDWQLINRCFTLYWERLQPSPFVRRRGRARQNIRKKVVRLG